MVDVMPSAALRLSTSLVPVVLSLLLFAPSVCYSEWYIDELFAVLRNEDARGESSIWQVFTNDFWGSPLNSTWTHKSYRPLTVLSFALQWRFLEEGLFRPQPLRAFNVLLHAANGGLLHGLLRCIGLSRFWALLAACWFAAHPVHTENVVYLVGRADMLATTGWLLAGLLQARSMSARSRRLRASRGGGGGLLAPAALVAGCLVLSTVAGLCKESGLTLLVYTAASELCAAADGPASAGHSPRSVATAAAALASFAAISAARFWVTGGSAAAFGFTDTPVQYQGDAVVRAWSYMQQHAYYAKLLVLPGQLSWDYSFDAMPVMRAAWRDARSLSVASAYLAVAALSAAALSRRRSNSAFGPQAASGGRLRGRRRLAMGIVMTVVPFVPASNLFFTVGVTVGERLLYPSSAGAALALAAFSEVAERKGATAAPTHRRLSRLLWRVFGLALVLHACWRCAVRVGHWRSSEALYEADAQSWPRSVKTRHQVATVYHAQDRYEEALANYNASLQVLDDNALTDHCMAQIFIETGRLHDALHRFEKIYAGHGVGFSHFNVYMLYIDYGFTLTSLGKHAEAAPLLQRGLDKNLAVPHGLNALGHAQYHLGNMQGAQDALAKGLEYDPDNALIWSNLAAVWMNSGALQQAAQGLERALLLEPDTPSVLHNANVLALAARSGGAGSLSLGAAGLPRLELFFTRSM